MRRLAGLAHAALIACTVAFIGAHAGERPSVDGWPGYAVGKVNVRGGGFCTATLIRRDRVVTSAHCLRDGVSWIAVNRLVVELAPHRQDRMGYATVERVIAAPGLAFDSSGKAKDPATDWAVLQLAEGGVRDAHVQPVPVASVSERESLGEGSVLTLVAYTRQRPFVATIGEGCAFRQATGAPMVLLHDCIGDAAVAGAAVFAQTDRGTVLVGIQIGTGALEDRPVGIAALLEQVIDPAMLQTGDTNP